MLSFICVIQCKNTSSQVFERANKFSLKKSSGKIWLASPQNILSGLILHINDEKWQSLTMLQLNVVHLNIRNISMFNNLYIIHDNFEKKYSGKMCSVLLQETG